MKIKYTHEALHDVERLEWLISMHDPSAARRVAGDLLDGIERLKVFPRMGLPVMRAPDSDVIRDLYVGTYTIRYLISSDVIYVLRLWHDKENEKDAL